MTEILSLKCEKCGHKWLARKKDTKRYYQCPMCRSFLKSDNILKEKASGN